MSERSSKSLIQTRWDVGCNVCVGLDTSPNQLPEGVRSVAEFNSEIIRATCQYACAYKPNIAFYEANGEAGLSDLRNLIEFAHHHCPEIPLICDAKRGDNANSNKGYVQSILVGMRFDAVTVQPYMGSEAIKPFLDCGNKTIFVLSRTSNPGAGEIQDLEASLTKEQIEQLAEGPSGSTPNILKYATGNCGERYIFPLFRVIALKVANHWNINGNCGVVSGATCPEHLGVVRELVRDLPILVPGIGAQGGDVEICAAKAKNSCGDGMILSNSRGITRASSRADFAEAAAQSARAMNEAIARIRRLNV